MIHIPKYRFWSQFLAISENHNLISSSLVISLSWKLFRAKYIVGTVAALQSKPGGGREWLASLRKLDLQGGIDGLLSLPGVGPKVAACIALFSLDQHHAIPVDTHVWQVSTSRLLTTSFVRMITRWDYWKLSSHVSLEKTVFFSLQMNAYIVEYLKD